MSSFSQKGNNYNKKDKRHKITTINLDITSSSSNSSSSHKSVKEYKDNKASPPKIKQLFSDSDENDKKEEGNQNLKNDEEDLTYGFQKAINKKYFQGEKGQMLLKLQNSYANDNRFKLDFKFKDDINFNKLPSELKNSKNNNLYNYEELDKEAKDEDIEFEKKRNMSILAEILPNTAFLDHKSIEKPINKLIIKRFDPKLKLGNASVETIKVDKKLKKEKEKNVIKLEKGVQIFTDKNDMELYNKYNDIDKMKKREKEKLISDTINKINDEMNQEIKINYNSWKKGIFEKNDNNFALFGGGDENNLNESTEQKNEKEMEMKSNNENDSKKEDEMEKKKSEKEILRRKKKREKAKLKKKEKKKMEKEKMKNKKEKIKRKNEEINEEYKDYLVNEFGEEKAKKHLKYIDMIQEYKKNKK